MKQKAYGFTLVEIAIVVTVVAALAGIIVVSFVTVQQRSRDDRRKADVSIIREGIRNYYNENGELPKPGGWADWGYDGSSLGSFLVPTYIPSIPLDPTGAEYAYAYSNDNKSYALRINTETLGGYCLVSTNNYKPAGWAFVQSCPSSWSS